MRSQTGSLVFVSVVVLVAHAAALAFLLDGILPARSVPIHPVVAIWTTSSAKPASKAKTRSLPPSPREPAIARTAPYADTPASDAALPEASEEPIPEPEFWEADRVTTQPVVPSGLVLSRIHYPEKARRLGVQAVVVLELSIGPDGQIRAVRSIEDPGYGFAASAEKALVGLVCEPARQGDRPVGVRLRYPVRFTLNLQAH